MERHSTIQHLVPAALAAAAAQKPIELQLAWYLDDYKVVAITNTTILKPGEWLSVAAVDQINKAPGWATRIADNNLLAVIAGAVGGIGALKI